MESSFLPTFSAAAHAYRAAWDNPAHTRFELPPVNVNKVLCERYRMRPQKALDRRYHRPFEEMVAAGWLPGFIEIYIAKDLGGELARV